MKSCEMWNKSEIIFGCAEKTKKKKKKKKKKKPSNVYDQRSFTGFFSFETDHLSGKELFIRFTARAFRKLLSIYVFSYFPLGFEGRIWELIVSVPDYCLSFYFGYQQECLSSVSLPEHRYSAVSFTFTGPFSL